MTTRRRFPGHPLAALLGLAVLTLVTAPAAAQPDAYSAAEIRGRVVDAETKQPVEGVHVVAQWILQTGIFHSVRVTRLHIMETVTDVKGEYYFAAWGPKPRPPLSSRSTADPRLTFFKPGYRVLERNNREPPSQDALGVSIWHGKIVSLDPFRGTPEQWAFLLGIMQDTLAWGDHTDEVPRRINDYWRQFPRVVLTILQQRRSLPVHVQDRVSTLDTWHITEDELRALVGQKGP